MAQPPRFKSFSQEAFPGAPAWFTPFLLALNEVMSGLVSAITRGLTRKENLLAGEKIKAPFTTSLTPHLKVKHGLEVRPTHCWVTDLQRADGTAITTAYSMTWKLNQSGEIECTFQGLSASTSYSATIAFE